MDSKSRESKEKELIKITEGEVGEVEKVMIISDGQVEKLRKHEREVRKINGVEVEEVREG